MRFRSATLLLVAGRFYAKECASRTPCQLTPDQIAELQSYEEHTGLESDDLLYFARTDAAANLHHSVEFGHIEPPPDAVRCFRWQPEEGGDVWFCEFWGESSQPRDAGVVVFVSGRQFSDARHCERGVTIAVNRLAHLTAIQARELADLLRDVADGADQPE